MRDEDDARPGDVRAWRDAYREVMGAGSEACPVDEALAALATGELAGEERLRLADHVARCRRCAATQEVLFALHREAERGRRPAHPWSVALAAAAALVVAVVGVTQLRGPTPSAPEDTLRGGVQGVLPAPGAVLAAPPDELLWPAQPGASAYRARLYRADGDALWESAPLAEPRLRLSAPVLDLLAPGHAYFWTVEGQGAGGPSRLGPFWFQVAQRR